MAHLCYLGLWFRGLETMGLEPWGLTEHLSVSSGSLSLLTACGLRAVRLLMWWPRAPRGRKQKLVLLKVPPGAVIVSLLPHFIGQSSHRQP